MSIALFCNRSVKPTTKKQQTTTINKANRQKAKNKNTPFFYLNCKTEHNITDILRCHEGYCTLVFVLIVHDVGERWELDTGQFEQSLNILF